MSVEFAKARNGEETCSRNGFFLHSRFSPTQEAERFAQSLEVEGTPALVVITGPCLSYAAPSLRKRFPRARVYAVQYDRAFQDTEPLFERTLYSTDFQCEQELSEALFNALGEETAFLTQFVSWKPSETAWPDEYGKTWKALKKCMEKSRDVVGTRAFFQTRWAKNTIRFFTFAAESATLGKTDAPIVICASGPSLRGAFPFLKANRSRFVLAALSSAIRPLLAQGLVPDLALTTDGGFWAKKHLAPLETEPALRDVPLCAAAESALPTGLLKNHPLVRLAYGDFFESLFTANSGADALPAKRNGTVSGTAAELALELTSGNVYFCGLDLAAGNGLQHTQPNEIEAAQGVKDNRLFPQETRITPSTFGNGSLNVYRAWFSTRPERFTSRVFRLLPDDGQYLPLGNIRDIRVSDAELPAQSAKPLAATKSAAPQEKTKPAEVLRGLKSSFIRQDGTPLAEEFSRLLALPEFLRAKRYPSDEAARRVRAKALDGVDALIGFAEQLEGGR